MEKDLPNQQESVFMYQMLLLWKAMDMRLLGKISVKSLGLEVEELSSLLATSIVEVKPNSSHD